MARAVIGSVPLVGGEEHIGRKRKQGSAIKISDKGRCIAIVLEQMLYTTSTRICDDMEVGVKFASL